MVDKVALGRVCVRVCRFSSVSIISHQCSILIFILILLLSEGQAGEAWQASNKYMLCRMSDSIEQKSTLLLFLVSFNWLKINF
jgi:hypothetical protein